MSRKVNLYLTQGEDFALSISMLDANGAPYNTSLVANSVGLIRKSYISVNAVTMNVSVNTGILTLGVAANQTASMVPGRYIYDVKLIDASNVVVKPISGMVTVAASATD